MPKLSEMEPGEAAQRLYDAYMAAHQRYTDDPNGTEGVHPSKDYNRWKTVGAVAGDENSGLGPKTIQKQGTSVAAADDPPNFADRPESATALENNRVEGQRLQAAQDAQDDRIRMSGAADIAGDLALASALRSDPRRIRAMSGAIKGYDRLK